MAHGLESTRVKLNMKTEMSLKVDGHGDLRLYLCSLSQEKKLNIVLQLIELDHKNPGPFM